MSDSNQPPQLLQRTNPLRARAHTMDSHLSTKFTAKGAGENASSTRGVRAGRTPLPPPIQTSGLKMLDTQLSGPPARFISEDDSLLGRDSLWLPSKKADLVAQNAAAVVAAATASTLLPTTMEADHSLPASPAPSLCPSLESVDMSRSMSISSPCIAPRSAASSIHSVLSQSQSPVHPLLSTLTEAPTLAAGMEDHPLLIHSPSSLAAELAEPAKLHSILFPVPVMPTSPDKIMPSTVSTTVDTSVPSTHSSVSTALPREQCAPLNVATIPASSMPSTTDDLTTAKHGDHAPKDTGMPRTDVPASEVGQEDWPFKHPRYHLVRLIGSGSFAQVWLAYDLDESRRVAIKVVQKRAAQPVDTVAVVANVERARKEAALLKTLHHPNIISIYDEIETDDVYCLVLEYADAGDLYDWTTQWYQSADATMTTQAKNNTPSSATIPEWMARDIFGQLAHALHYLHERDITHRDVKLENVLLARIPVTAAHPLGLRVILADFGLAISMTPSDMQQPLAAGSDEYAAPEVVLSAGSATVSMGSALSTGADGTPGYTRSKTDVWALGVVLYALLFGQLPFLRKPNQTRRSFLYRVARGDVQFPVREHMSAEALEVVRALLRRRPGERPSVSTVMSMAWMQGWEPLSLSQSTIRYPQQHHTLNRTPYATKTTLAAH